jgi:hypothetical protein
MPRFLILTRGMSHVTHPASLLRLLPSDLTRYFRKSKSRNGKVRAATHRIEMVRGAKNGGVSAIRKTMIGRRSDFIL